MDTYHSRYLEHVWRRIAGQRMTIAEAPATNHYTVHCILIAAWQGREEERDGGMKGREGGREGREGGRGGRVEGEIG